MTFEDWGREEEQRGLTTVEEMYADWKSEREVYVAELSTCKRERDFAIAHDTQPYPTAEAYERVCAARTKWQSCAEENATELSACKERVAQAWVDGYVEANGDAELTEMLLKEYLQAQEQSKEVEG